VVGSLWNNLLGSERSREVLKFLLFRGQTETNVGWGQVSSTRGKSATGEGALQKVNTEIHVSLVSVIARIGDYRYRTVGLVVGDLQPRRKHVEQQKHDARRWTRSFL
jgi:hypothetical protein